MLRPTLADIGRIVAVSVLLSAVLIASPTRVLAQAEMVLYSFGSSSVSDGMYPIGNLVVDGKGNVYGTTSQAMPFARFGTVFEVSPIGTEKILYEFGSQPGDGGQPKGGLVRDSKGNLYGTTSDPGTLFEMVKSGKNYTEKVLYTFANIIIDGAYPTGELVRDKEGNFYGTTYGGGSNSCSCGTVFKLGSDGTLTTLHTFSGNLDGANPYGGVVRDSKGNLYGATLYGGNPESCDYQGCGTIFEITAEGEEKILYVFTGFADGSIPYSSLLRDAKGNLYGTTWSGGYFGEETGCFTESCGTVFELTKKGALVALHAFTGYPGDGGNSYAGLVMDKQDNLYGTTYDGGAYDGGAVFEVTPTGVEKVLHSFNPPDGVLPQSGLTFDGDGNLYGTTFQGGTLGYGTVFKLVP